MACSGGRDHATRMNGTHLSLRSPVPEPSPIRPQTVPKRSPYGLHSVPRRLGRVRLALFAAHGRRGASRGLSERPWFVEARRRLESSRRPGRLRARNRRGKIGGSGPLFRRTAAGHEAPRQVGSSCDGLEHVAMRQPVVARLTARVGPGRRRPVGRSGVAPSRLRLARSFVRAHDCESSCLCRSS